MAAGNQEEKGNWALFVKAKKINKTSLHSLNPRLEKNCEVQFSTTLKANNTNKNKSPTRLDKIVS